MSRCFNSRAREGRDTRADGITSLSVCFNSRAREGRDGQFVVLGLVERTVSIHAPARGATQYSWSWPATAKGFNSRAREGRDLNDLRPRNKVHLFQFTRPRGARLVGEPHDNLLRGFNSRAREGRDRPSAGYRPCRPSFNSRAREGRDNDASVR